MWDLARQVWDAEYTVAGEFNKQVEAQRAFRENYDFLLTDDVTVADAIASSRSAENVSFEEMGLVLTDPEWTEFDRRDDLISDYAADVRQAVASYDLTDESRWPNFGPLYGGTWIDQLDGGKLHLAVTDLADAASRNLDSLVPRGNQDLELVEVAYSFEELVGFHSVVADELEAAGYTNFGVGVRARDNAIVVKTDVAIDVPLSVPPDAVVFDVRPGEQIAHSKNAAYYEVPSLNYVTFGASQQQPGLRIGVYKSNKTGGWGCTWGFNGHSANYNYLLTAGHCVDDAEGGTSGVITTSSDWRQNATGTWRGDDRHTRAINTSTRDAAGLLSGYANDNCYFTTSNCSSRITSRQSWNNISESQNICASLSKSRVYACGYIDTWPYSEPGINFRIEVDMETLKGDSGAGGKWGKTARGILTEGGNGASTSLFMPIYYMVDSIRDLNCVWNPSTSWWKKCPVV